MGGVWSGAELDLDAYLGRVGFTGEPTPTAATLRTLHTAHVLALPFENLGITLGQGAPLDLPSIQGKLIAQRRGGYCYEHTTLFAAVLERLGFGVTALSSRVHMSEEKLTPATHAVLRVATEETADTGLEWLCDVGGGGQPLAPLPATHGAETSAGDWHYRMEWRTVAPGTEGWTLYLWEKDGWRVRHNTVDTPQFPVDYLVGNHYVATSSHSPFTTRPVAARNTGAELRFLDGRTLTTTRAADHHSEAREVRPEEMPELLAEEFGIVLEPADARRLVDRSAALPPTDSPVDEHPPADERDAAVHRDRTAPEEPTPEEPAPAER
ncbi:arylamine N-acetyltransferase [Streptomyces sp. AJS327]|uniref:arylamine N-acetyltransferase family protein n=1 Tax=Streptomyces sp. AJS327 TaxID=2545265 RepID=UPI0015DDD435|nr:arylamine N-acetyltransferase [Streptomyces sp. AJS327]MBA0049362.1 arylamine N-acetyltransferase [Streptomyces sp. AJS327]